MTFLCGTCCFKRGLSLSARVAMSKRVLVGDNFCSDCKKNVVGKEVDSKKNIQIGLF